MPPATTARSCRLPPSPNQWATSQTAGTIPQLRVSSARRQVSTLVDNSETKSPGSVRNFWLLWAAGDGERTDGVGFEPTRDYGPAGFQDRCLKPLGHPSISLISECVFA